MSFASVDLKSFTPNTLHIRCNCFGELGLKSGTPSPVRISCNALSKIVSWANLISAFLFSSTNIPSNPQCNIGNTSGKVIK